MALLKWLSVCEDNVQEFLTRKANDRISMIEPFREKNQISPLDKEVLMYITKLMPTRIESSVVSEYLKKRL